MKEDSLHYCCRVHRNEIDGRLVQVGKDLSRKLEHFRFEQEYIVVQEGKELGCDTLQSPDDKLATFRTKN